MRGRGSEEAHFSKILKKDDPQAAIAFLETSSLRRTQALALSVESCAEKVAIRLLAEGADPNTSLPSALVRAIEAGCHGIFDALHEAGADLGSDPWWEDGEHPLTSAAARADPVAMEWLCERGTVEISASEWIWEALALVTSSRKKGALEALFILAERVLARLQSGGLRAETVPLKKVTKKLQRIAKKDPRAERLRSALSGLLNEFRSEEVEILDLTRARRFEDLLLFIQATDGSNRSRRAGVALLWGTRRVVSVKLGDSGFEESEVGKAYLEELLTLEPDVQVSDDMGGTALMYAARNASLGFVQKLVALGFDLEAEDTEDHDSVLQWAEYSGDPEKVAWIKTALAERDS